MNILQSKKLLYQMTNRLNAFFELSIYCLSMAKNMTPPPPRLNDERLKLSLDTYS